MPSHEPLEKALTDFINSHRGQFDAIAGCDCAMSIAIRVLMRMGIAIPDEVALIGAGDTPLARYSVLPITTVSVNDEWIGTEAFSMLTNMIEGPPRLTFPSRFSQPSLIVRASTIKA